MRITLPKAVVLAATSLAIAAAAPPAARPRPNLVVVTLDTTRADHLGCYGRRDALTPNLDALAAAGTRFVTAVTPAPITLPAHVSLFTGLEPAHHGVRHNGDHLAPTGPPTLAQHLSGAGYETGAFVSAFILDQRFGLDRGFDTYDDAVDPATSGFPSGILERAGEDTVDAASAWIATRSQERPYFAWIHLFGAHAPYEPPPLFADRFRDRPYAGEIASDDYQLGRLLALVDATSGPGGTVVAVTADHGEGLGEHGEDTHAFFLYDSTLRVPLLLRGPGVPKGSIVEDRIVSLVDLVPTLLPLLGQPVPAGLDGLDAFGPVPADRVVFAESLSPFLDFGWAPLAAARRLRDKAIHAPRPEYYDLARDPRELDNRADQDLPTRRTLTSALESHLASLPSFAEARPAAVTPEDRAALAALGYVSGAGPKAQAGATATLDDPKDRVRVVADLVRANGLQEAGRDGDALRLLRETAIRTGGDRSTVWAMAKLLVRMGRSSDAVKALRRLEAEAPTADALLLLAQILIQEPAHRAEASELLARAESLDRHHGGVLLARGDLAWIEGKPTAARALYTQAIARDPARVSAVATARIAALDRGAPPPGRNLEK